MGQAQKIQQSTRSTPRPSLRRRAAARLVTAGVVVAGSLCVAAPSWAGPLTGC